MSICRCQVCGGNLILKQDHFAVCDSCRTEQFLPRIDANVTNLYERANHMRRMANFDGAAKLFNQVLDRYAKDAATYWQIVLCKFGVYHQWDERTQSFKPTLHRMMRTSLLTDPDYLKALEYATAYERDIYQREAQEIFSIQQRYERISQKEKAFDVFISYKETDDETHQRTPDSELAHSLYNELTAQGLRVFFSHITLREKSGEDYEPYIFAALESAPVMLLVATSPRYVNGVWVRNEWMRYLNLIAINEDKVLIPVVRDMNPYDLPDEISHLQAVNLRNVGAKQELVQRVMSLSRQSKAVAAPHRAEAKAVSVEPLVKGMYRQFADGVFDGPQGAYGYIARIQAIEPNHADGYLGRMMLEQKARYPDNLINSDVLLNTNENYRKAMLYGDEGMQNKLVGLLEKQQRRIYKECMSFKSTLSARVTTDPEKVDLEELVALRNNLGSLSGYQDADAQHKAVQQMTNQFIITRAQKLEAEKKYEEALELVSRIEGDDRQAAMDRKLRNAIDRRDKLRKKKENKESGFKYFAIISHLVVLIALVYLTFVAHVELFPWFVRNPGSVLAYLGLGALALCSLSNGLTSDVTGDPISFVCAMGHIGIPLLIGINTLLCHWQPGTSILSGAFIDGLTTGAIVGGIVYLGYCFIAWVTAKIRGCDFEWIPYF